jgi:short subunit dehydrogenase-like uncharacterized protein
VDDQRASVAVYGAAGHTGRFVVAELRRRAIPVVAVGRDPARLPPEVPTRIAKVDDPAGMGRAFAGCGVVINCAGPFLDTAGPVADAALRAGCSYLDVTAEQASAQATFQTHDRCAREAGLAVIPAAGFYGGLADLLASAVLGEDAADTITTAVALDRWWPTEGTRRTGERNRVPRLVVARSAGTHVPACREHGLDVRCAARSANRGRNALQRSHHHHAASTGAQPAQLFERDGAR